MGVTSDIKTAGDGKNFPKKGDKLKMHYTGTLQDGGKQFDSSRDRGQEFEFTIGVGQVIKGWDEGVMKMSLGERAVLHIPSEFGYGANGAGADIPPNADLDFDVELIAINGKKAFYTQAEADKFAANLAAWKEKQLAKYDKSETFKGKKDAKHTDRDGFEKFLTEEVAKSVAEVPLKKE